MSTSGGTAPTTNAPGPFTVTGLETLSGGEDSSGHGFFASPAIVSGTPFTPAGSGDAYVQVYGVTPAAGNWIVQYGPTTGLENVWLPTQAFLLGEGVQTGLYVPKGWKVTVGITGAGNTLGASVHRI